MHVGLLFYSDTIFLSQGGATGIMGRSVANHDFLRALLNTTERVSLFVTTDAEKIFLDDYFKKSNLRQVKIVPYLKLKNFLKEKPIDVLHCLDVNLYRGMHVRDAVKQNFAVTGLTHSLGHAPFLEWLYLNLISGAKPCDSLVCTTPTANDCVAAMQAHAQKKAPQLKSLRQDIIPLGVDFENFSKHTQNVRRELNIKDDETVFLSLSRLSSRLKADLVPLLIAFKDVVKQAEKPARLVIAGATGDENYHEELNRAIAGLGLNGKVQLVTNPDDTTKKSLYKSADVFVAVSDNTQETFGLTLLEAMSSGLPVIACDWDGYKSLVKHNENGMLVPTRTLRSCEAVSGLAAIQLDSFNQLLLSQSVAFDVAQMTKALMDLCHNVDKRKTMSDNALLFAKKHDWPEVMKKYQALWSELSALAKAYESPFSETPLAFDYYSIFAGYPSALLNDDDKITLSPFGTLVLQGKQPVSPYGGMEEILDLNLVTTLLKDTQSGKTVAELMQKNSLRFSADVVRYHVMWLMKYAMVGADNAGSSVIASEAKQSSARE